MERDMDLARNILIEVEKLSPSTTPVVIHIEGHTQEEVNYHLIILRDAGLLESDYVDANRRDYIWKHIRLTWAGHDFIDASRDNNIWKQAKVIATKAGTTAFPILLKILIDLGQTEVKKYLAK